MKPQQEPLLFHSLIDHAVYRSGNLFPSMLSFRFLNPRLVAKYPSRMDDVCYNGIRDEPDVLCHDLPPNRLRFLGWWYLSPERHFQEWAGFMVVGVTVVALLGSKVSSKYTPSITAKRNALTPRRWMIGSSLLFYPYVASTKLSWPGSNYHGRWLLFVGMPVGTLWILSFLFCCSGICLRRRDAIGNQNSIRDDLYKVRYWLLETWFSFLPLLVDLLPGLFGGAMLSVWQYAHGKAPRSGHDGDNAEIAYFCHALYLVLAPAYYFWIGELSLHPTRKTNARTLWMLAVDCALRQVVGTAICSIYYMGIITPASIILGLNVNFLLYDGGGPNFRIYCVAMWFFYGCGIRIFLAAAKLAWEKSQTLSHRDGDDDDGDIESNNNDKSS